MKIKTKDLVNVAILSALAYVIMIAIHIGMFGFLTLDFKNVIITIAGFIYGPLVTVLVSFIVAFVEMITISTTGIIGFAMNFFSTVAFCTLAAWIYKRRKNLKHAITGLGVGVVVMTIIMLIMNLILTPLYTGMTTAQVADMILPVLLPFNLIKGISNAALIMLIYKPLVNALRQVGILKKSETEHATHSNKLVLVISLVVLALCILAILKMNGVI